MYGQVKFGYIANNTKNDSSYISVAYTELELDGSSSLILVAEDTVKPSVVTILFASDLDSLDYAIRIVNIHGSDISLSRVRKHRFLNVSKRHKVLGIADLAWDKYEYFNRINPAQIYTTARSILLEEKEQAQLAYYYQYLAERIDDNSPPRDSVKFDVEPTVLKRTAPRYPIEALREGLEGSVLVKVWVDREGKVRDVVIQKSDAPIFNAPAVEAASQWLFTPAKINGMAISVWIAIPFKFRVTGLR
jgi:TonB family protein